MKLGHSIHPDEDAPYSAVHLMDFHVSRCLALSTAKGGNLAPAADPHPALKNLLHTFYVWGTKIAM